MFKSPVKLDSFAPYEPLVGDYKIRLDVNESFIEVSPEKIAEVIKGVNLNRYPDPYATEAVRAFSELFKINPKFVTAGNGSDELIALISSALLQKGDKVLCFSPDFSMYAFYSKLNELEVATYPKNEDFTFDIDEVVKFIRENEIKCVAFSNPCNPTSLGVPKAEITRLIEGASDTLIVLDEAYMDFWDEAESATGEIENYDNLIVLRTCSKSVALAGIRLGFAVASERISKLLKTAKSPYNVNVLSQSIGAHVLADKENYEKSIALIKKSASEILSEIKRLSESYGAIKKICETKTNFVFFEVENAKNIYEFLLNQGIAVRYFPENYLRICAGSAHENSELFKALTDYFKREKK